ncbi:MAG: methyltransferase domain-containing protein [Acidimicrobiaceae bacterium]|nr:methyltransferase domain-containing protein [Acidimicrobiaceae bacterium]MBO0746770.1 methyltransferase domain-containing protein [Acidimicrobiaceae bacterium]
MSLVDQIRNYWDIDSATYDRAEGHRPTSSAEKSAWSAAFARLLPAAPARVLDCGAGTGFLSLIAARLGHKVTALDVSTGMLAQLRARADTEGLGIDIIEGPAEHPPPGPFDAVIERHVVWTLPDPAAALAAWRGVAPYGRLVLVEGVWGKVDPVEKARARLRNLVRQVRRIPDDHHAPYASEIAEALPFSHGTQPSALVDMVAAAGWPDPRIERLRDVEWAANMARPLPERLIGVSPRYVVSAG